MRIKSKSMFGFLAVILALGISIAVLPQAANAQTDKENKEKKQVREDDNNDDDENLSSEDKKQVKISMEEARAIALKRVSGSVIDEELEKENGRLQYAFDIRDAAGKVFDVEIDAITGEVLQAGEDDEDGDTGKNGLSKTKNSLSAAAGSVKNVFVKTMGKLFD